MLQFCTTTYHCIGIVDSFARFIDRNEQLFLINRIVMFFLQPRSSDLLPHNSDLPPLSRWWPNFQSRNRRSSNRRTYRSKVTRPDTWSCRNSCESHRFDKFLKLSWIFTCEMDRVQNISISRCEYQSAWNFVVSCLKGHTSDFEKYKILV